MRPETGSTLEGSQNLPTALFLAPLPGCRLFFREDRWSLLRSDHRL